MTNRCDGEKGNSGKDNPQSLDNWLGNWVKLNMQNILAWRTPGTGEPGGLLSLGSHRVRHD